MQPSAWYNNDPSAKPTLFKLLAADGFTIDTYEEGHSPWTLAFDRTSPGLFLLPTWRYPSLVHYKLAVHMNPRTLSDKAMNIHVLGTPTSPQKSASQYAIVASTWISWHHAIIQSCWFGWPPNSAPHQDKQTTCIFPLMTTHTTQIGVRQGAVRQDAEQRRHSSFK